MRILPEVIQRIYTAIPLVGVGLASVFYFNETVFIVIDTLLILAIGWEWSRVCGYENCVFRSFYLVALLVGCSFVSYLPVRWVAVLSALMGSFLVSCIAIALRHGNAFRYPRGGLAVLGGAYLLFAWYMLCFLKREPVYLGMGLLIVVLTDTLAYIVGKRWGNFPLAPYISPHKTWEGCLAGLFGPVLVMLILDKLSGYLLGINRSMVSIIILTALVAIAGDLFESAVKRQSGLKDSGNGLPGHGGWLDRFDGLICAIPIFSAGLFYLATF